MKKSRYQQNHDSRREKRQKILCCYLDFFFEPRTFRPNPSFLEKRPGLAAQFVLPRLRRLDFERGWRGRFVAVGRWLARLRGGIAGTPTSGREGGHGGREGLRFIGGLVGGGVLREG